MSEEDIVAQISEYIVASFALGEVTFDADDNLLIQGVIDSLGLLDLVAFVEERYGVLVDDSEVDLDNFGSVRSIARFVLQKLGDG